MPEYLEQWKRLATPELEKHPKKSNYINLRRGDALFDIIDKDGSSCISLDEWIGYTDSAGIQQTKFQSIAKYQR